MKCTECSSEMRVQKATHEKPYHFERCGLDNVFLAGIDLHICDRCNFAYPIIPRIQDLHRTIASILIEKRAALEGQEIRYLRKWIGMEAQAFAEILGLRPEHLSKVENGKLPLGAAAERLTRVYAMTYKQKMEFGEISERLPRVQRTKDARTRRANLPHRCQFRGNRWRVEEEAKAA